jgi:hypothetical protein
MAADEEKPYRSCPEQPTCWDRSLLGEYTFGFSSRVMKCSVLFAVSTLVPSERSHSLCAEGLILPLHIHTEPIGVRSVGRLN